MRQDMRHGKRQAAGMDEFNEDDLSLDAVETVVLDVLRRLGDGPETRFAFFRRLLSVAKETIRERDSRSRTVPASPS